VSARSLLQILAMNPCDRDCVPEIEPSALADVGGGNAFSDAFSKGYKQTFHNFVNVGGLAPWKDQPSFSLLGADGTHRNVPLFPAAKVGLPLVSVGPALLGGLINALRS
jgi:hypothetical protein